MNESLPQGSSASKVPFATTCWSLVHAAGIQGSPESRRALATLCACYWAPLYAFVRRKGYQVAEAQDVTQDFFVEFLEKNRFQRADETRGRFRSFLLASLNHFLLNRWRDAHREKRGGQFSLFSLDKVGLDFASLDFTSLDFAGEERRFATEPSERWTPEKLFERRWATAILDNAMKNLRQEQVDLGKIESFEAIQPYISGAETQDGYAELADRLATTEGALKVAIHRLRRRCRELIREEIAQTLSNPQDIDDELRQLFAALD